MTRNEFYLSENRPVAAGCFEKNGRHESQGRQHSTDALLRCPRKCRTYLTSSLKEVLARFSFKKNFLGIFVWLFVMEIQGQPYLLDLAEECITNHKSCDSTQRTVYGASSATCVGRPLLW
jgi:hypothetical protein